MAGYYTQAAVCRRGHVETSVVSERVDPRCSRCGAEILTGCPVCGARIRGQYMVPGVVNLGQTYRPPDFCDQCAFPFPWAGREARIYQLQNLLDDEGLDAADELMVREQLQALLSPELDEKEQVKRWKRVMSGAPGFLEKAAAQPVVASLLTAAAKQTLGLPPV